MPNLILTNKCYNGCSFCFVDSKNNGRLFTKKKLQALLPFIQSFNRKSVHLLGGEPTLNPEFFQILEGLLQEGFRVKVFTNGKLPTKLVERLQSLHKGEFCFCVNRTDPHLTPKIIQFYRKLGHKIELSVTVYQSEQPLDHMLAEIFTYHLSRNFRLGIALPIWPTKPNTYLRLADYTTVANEIFSFIREAVVAGVKPEFDCGFPYCFFNDRQKAFLTSHKIQFASLCGPIPDIGPDHTASHCFPLAKLAHPVSKSSTWPALQHDLKETFSSVDLKPIFEECTNCPSLADKRCSGGCAAFRMVPQASHPDC